MTDDSDPINPKDRYPRYYRDVVVEDTGKSYTVETEEVDAVPIEELEELAEYWEDMSGRQMQRACAKELREAIEDYD